MKNKHIGSTLESFFDELGEGEEFRLVAQKKALVIAAEQQMSAFGISKNALAKRMGTSRPAIDRLLDPENTSLTFTSLNRATRALGLDFSIAFFEAKPPRAPRPTRRGKGARGPAKKPQQVRKLYFSTDAATTWSEIGDFLPARRARASYSPCTQVGVCPFPSIIDATTFLVGCGTGGGKPGIYRSTDAGMKLVMRRWLGPARGG